MATFDINTFWLLLALLAALIVYWLWTQTRRDYSKFNVPPYPVKPWPIVGHFFLLFGDLRDNLKKWRQSGGDIYSLDLKGHLHILVNNFNDIKEIWVKHADYIVNLQPSFGDELLNEENKGITAGRDENWKEQRSASLSILRSFGMGKNVMADKIQEEVSVLLKTLLGLKEQPTDVKLLLKCAVSNVISSVAVGKRFDYSDPFFSSLVARIHIFIKYFGIVMLQTSFKAVSLLPGDLFHSKKWVKACRDLNEEYTKPFLSKFKKEFDENEEPESFIAAYLKEMKKVKGKGEHSNLNEENLIAVVRTLFGAGTDTSSITILWCLLYMLHHPDVQEKVYREIEVHVGTERTPNMADKPKLTYLNAVIMETQRMSSLVPVGLRREVSSSFEYGGFSFPKGCILWSILDSVHYDKKIWGDPENFRPERFIDKNGALINREELIPFGIGRRVCLGESLAKMELFLFLSAIFQRFKCEPEDKSGELPSLKAIMGTVVVPEAFKLRIMERKV